MKKRVSLTHTIGFLVITSFLMACTEINPVEQDTEEGVVEIQEEAATAKELSRPKRDSIHSEEQTMAPVDLVTFSASWFQIEYPSNFTASPTSPTKVWGDYEFVDTDEATFTSPDGTVEFFIYSPQWSGNPKNYMVKKDNEKIVDQKQEAEDSDDPFAVTHRWVTFEDKNGAYTRAYHSMKTESTHHVFGVKYSNRKMYERYKAAYLAFKKSLRQFAD